MQGYTYEHIIDTYLEPFLQEKYEKNCFLIQDNDPKHHFYFSEEAYERNNIKWVYFDCP